MNCYNCCVSCLQCQLGVLPLGTGNDLSRVLGWGTSFDDDNAVTQFLQHLERAKAAVLDRYFSNTVIIIAINHLSHDIDIFDVDVSIKEAN